MNELESLERRREEQLDVQAQREKEFNFKYGQEFGNDALEYGRWQKHGMQTHMVIKGKHVPASELQQRFASGLISILRKQQEEGMSEENQNEWINTFLDEQRAVAANKPSFIPVKLK